MSLFKYEMKKMFFYHNGLLFVVLYFVISIAAAILFDTPANPGMEKNIQQYACYLNQVKGQCSDSTERFLSREANTISDAETALQKAYDNFYDGNISESTFVTEAAIGEGVLQNKAGFELIYNQYTYVRENPVNRYFLYTNGWDGLLSYESLDFLFILLLLLLIAPVFCYEFESKMDSFILTIKNGTRYHALVKVGLVFITVTVLCLLHSGLQYTFFDLKYGLDNGNYPLQSLSCFGSATKSITLIQALLWVSACKFFGYLNFAMLIMFTSVCVKKYALTLFSCTVILLLPYYGLALQSDKYFLPGPLGFIVATGYLKGNENKHNLITDQMDVVFREVSDPVWRMLFITTLCIGVGMFIIVMIRNTNAWCLKKPGYQKKRMFTVLILCTAISFLSGCVSQTDYQSSAIYNYNSAQFYENEECLFYVGEITGEKTGIVFKNKETGETGNLVRTPLQSLMSVSDSIYGDGSYVYYMKYDFERSKNHKTYDKFSVIEVNTETYNEKIIYEVNMNVEKDNFLGIGRINEADALYFVTVNAFFLNKNSIYFTDGKEITRVSRTTGKMDTIIQSPTALTSIAFDGHYIYFTNLASIVMQYDTKTDSETVVSDIVTKYFILTDTELLFINRKDKRKIYSMRLDDYTVQKITDKPALWFSCDDQYIYYQDYEGLEQYRIDRDGQNEMVITD